MALSWLVFFALPAKRANMHRNLRVVLTGSSEYVSSEFERRAKRLAHRSMRSYGQVLADFVMMDRMIPLVQRDTEATPGWEHLDNALAAGRGAIFVTAHYGHWDMAGVAVAHHYPGRTSAVAENFTHGKLNEMVVSQRSSYGLGVVPMDNVRQMSRVLREGKILGILADRPVTSGEGVSVRFFGKETRFPAGAAVLAQLARCPILVGSLRRRPDGRFEGTISPPIMPVRTGNRESDTAATMQLVVEQLEHVIRRSPHQWYMFRDMWPAGQPVRLATRSLGARWIGVAAALVSQIAGTKAARSASSTSVQSGLTHVADL
jgi:KDO2-lipid IV(A) lauroyltransferase